jgi:hypothetical protein
MEAEYLLKANGEVLVIAASANWEQLQMLLTLTGAHSYWFPRWNDEDEPDSLYRDSWGMFLPGDDSYAIVKTPQVPEVIRLAHLMVG